MNFLNAYALTLSCFVNAGAMVLYTVMAFLSILKKSDSDMGLTGAIQMLAWTVFVFSANLTLMMTVPGDGTPNASYLFLGLAEWFLLLMLMLLYRTAWNRGHMLLLQNICMLLSVGYVIISRIDITKAVKQLIISVVGLIIFILLPLFRKHLESLKNFKYIYGLLGLISLGGVFLLGAMVNGANLSLTVGGFAFQPSEFMKIVFILFMASALCDTIRKRDVLMTGFFALAHVGILVLSRDLGSAMIFYVIFIMMLFLATGRWRYVIGGILAGAAGSVVCYFLFSHVRVRVDVFMNPWNSNYIDNMSYQITQSLFAISYGGPWGAGLGRGMPERIPFVVSDFIFSAVAEELGLIFACCMIALCINCFLDVLLLSETYANRFFRLYTFGAGVCYIFQTFVTVGGEVKFIPLTGVTLPFVSYGGSSVLSSLIMFAVTGAIFILHSEREDRFRHRYESERAAYEKVPDRQDDQDDGYYRGFKPADDISRYEKEKDSGGSNQIQYYR